MILVGILICCSGMSDGEASAICSIFRKAKTLLLVGQTRQALNHAREGLRLAPDSVPMWHTYNKIRSISRFMTQGDMHMQSQNHEAALQSWNDALTVSREIMVRPLTERDRGCVS